MSNETNGFYAEPRKTDFHNTGVTTGATYEWLLPRQEEKMVKKELWTKLDYPQKDWIYQKECNEGVECDYISTAPSGRFFWIFLVCFVIYMVVTVVC